MFKNNPTGRIERFLNHHPTELNDCGGTFSSGMAPYTVAPFIVKYLKELTELAKPRPDDSDEYVE